MKLSRNETDFGNHIASRNLVAVASIPSVWPLADRPGLYHYTPFPGLVLRPLDKAAEKGYGCNALAFITVLGGSLIIAGDALRSAFSTGGKIPVQYPGLTGADSAVTGLREKIPETDVTHCYASTSTHDSFITKSHERLLGLKESTPFSHWPQRVGFDGVSTTNFCAFEVVTGANDGMVTFSTAPPYRDSFPLRGSYATGGPTWVADGYSKSSGALVKTLGMGKLHPLLMHSGVKKSITQSFPEDEGVRAWVVGNYDRIVSTVTNVELGFEIFVTPDQKGYLNGRRKFAPTSRVRSDWIGGEGWSKEHTRGVARVVDADPGRQRGWFEQPSGEACGVHRNFFLGMTEGTYDQMMIEVTGMRIGPWSWGQIIGSLLPGQQRPTEIEFVPSTLDSFFGIESLAISSALPEDISGQPGTRHSPMGLYKKIFDSSRGKDNFFYAIEAFNEILEAEVINHFS